MKRVCVYCGSRDGDHPTFATAAETVGTGIAKRISLDILSNHANKIGWLDADVEISDSFLENIIYQNFKN